MSGDVLHYFSTGLTGEDGQIYSLALRSLPEGTDLHASIGLKGAIYKFSVNSTPVVTDGSQVAAVDVQRMTDPSVNITYIKGLALEPSYEGPYGVVYVGVQDNRAVYRSRWGVDGNPGSQTWGMVNGAWSMAAWGDVAEVSRTDPSQGGLWTVEGNYVYRYPGYFWGTPSDKQMNIGTGLKGVALGAKDDLWLLTDGNQIMNVSAVDGSVIQQFQLSSAIAQPNGIEYDANSNTLWIGNFANSSIYQVAVPEPATIGLLVFGMSMFVAKRRHSK
jgi:hypothetical protein